MKNNKPLTAYSNSKQFLCCVTGEVIHPERVEYLLGEGVLEYNLTSINGANATYRPKKIIVVDDEGTEFFCDKIDETRAWSEERFGADADEDSIPEETERKVPKKIEEASPALIHESLDVVIKKEDTEEDDFS